MQCGASGHDVYVTDWHNARDVGVRDGGFDFDDFIDHLITFIEVLGPGTHVIGVCQRCVAVLAAVAVMAEDSHPAQPRSMTLMAARSTPGSTRPRSTAGHEPADLLVRAVMDLPAEFYLQTVRSVFQEHALPLGKFKWHGRRVDPRAIRNTALFTVEGERDDICAEGQTLAAQELCGSLRPYMKRHHVQTGVGHYGVFNGQRWRSSIYPILTNLIYASD